MALRIYLEYKPVSEELIGDLTGGRHLFLVLREEPIDLDQMLDETWRSSGDVIRGGEEWGIANGPLTITAGEPLFESDDALPDASYIADRGILDITDSFANGAADWDQMVLLAEGIGAVQYDYEIPGNHTANSNATILTVLNYFNVDVRSLLTTTFFPGADVGATLLGSTYTGDRIEASSALTAGVSLLGRDKAVA